MGRCHLRCKKRTLLLCSVSLLRVGDKFAFLLNSRLYFILFILYYCQFLYYCPKLGQKFFTKWCYSPDNNSFRFCLLDLYQNHSLRYQTFTLYTQRMRLQRRLHVTMYYMYYMYYMYLVHRHKVTTALLYDKEPKIRD